MMNFILGTLGVIVYLCIGYGLSLISYTLYHLGYKKLALLDMRHDHSSEVIIFTVAWPLVLTIAPIVSLVSLVIDFIISFSSHHSIAINWIDKKVSSYKEYKRTKHHLNPNIINKFKV